MRNLFILGMVLFNLNAFAGNEKGNGGGIHFCQSNNTQELYDLYEAQARYGYSLLNEKLTVNGYIEFALNKIKKNNPFVARLVNEQIQYLRNGHMITRPKVKLTPIEDTTILLLDEGCSYRQLANWDEVSGHLIVSKDLFESMNNLNKASLFIHEALYKVGRDRDLLKISANNTTTSDEIRRMVGEIFSDNDQLKVIWTITDPEITDGPAREELNELNEKCADAYNDFLELNTKADNKCDIKNQLHTSFSNAESICIRFKVTSMSQAASHSVTLKHRAYAFSIAIIADAKLAALNGTLDNIARTCR